MLFNVFSFETDLIFEQSTQENLKSEIGVLQEHLNESRSKMEELNLKIKDKQK